MVLLSWLLFFFWKGNARCHQWAMKTNKDETAACLFSQANGIFSGKSKYILGLFDFAAPSTVGQECSTGVFNPMMTLHSLVQSFLHRQTRSCRQDAWQQATSCTTLFLIRWQVQQQCCALLEQVICYTGTASTTPALVQNFLTKSNRPSLQLMMTEDKCTVG